MEKTDSTEGNCSTFLVLSYRHRYSFQHQRMNEMANAGKHLSIEDRLGKHENFLLRLYNYHISLEDEAKSIKAKSFFIEKNEVSNDNAFCELQEEVRRKLVRNETFAEAVSLSQELGSTCTALQKENSKLYDTKTKHLQHIDELSNMIKSLQAQLQVKESGCRLFKKKLWEAKKKNEELQKRLDVELRDKKNASELQVELEDVQRELQLQKLKSIRSAAASTSKSEARRAPLSSSTKRRTSSISLAQMVAKKKKKKNKAHTSHVFKWNIDGEDVPLQRNRGFKSKR